MVDFAEFKKFFFFNLIGALIISALVAVITILIGIFNEITARVLFTLLMVMIHSLISLAFIWDDEKQNTFDRLSFFTNMLFLIIIVSFITSIFGVWEIIPAEIVWNLYQTYFLIGFASLHSDILSKALNKEGYLDAIVYVNYVLIGIVVLMLLPLIYLDNAFRTLGEVYYRFLGAAGIIDGTLSILAIIFYKLHMQKHPRVENPLSSGGADAPKKERRGLSIWVWILLAYLFLQVVLPMGFWFLRGF